MGCCLACKPHPQKVPSPEQQRRLEVKVRLVDVDTESQASEPHESHPQPAEWLPAFLHKCMLDQHLPAFRDTNCEEMEDIQAIGRETMSRMGLTSMEAKRLQRYAAAAAAAATGPMVVHAAACGSVSSAPLERASMPERDGGASGSGGTVAGGTRSSSGRCIRGSDACGGGGGGGRCRGGARGGGCCSCRGEGRVMLAALSVDNSVCVCVVVRCLNELLPPYDVLYPPFPFR